MTTADDQLLARMGIDSLNDQVSVTDLMHLHSVAEQRLRNEAMEARAETALVRKDAAASIARMERRLHWMGMILFGAGLCLAWVVCRWRGL